MEVSDIDIFGSMAASLVFTTERDPTEDSGDKTYRSEDWKVTLASVALYVE